MVAVDTPAVEAEERLARHASAVLRRPLWRAEGAEGLSFPTVERGFVSPSFRNVTCHTDHDLDEEDRAALAQIRARLNQA